MTAELRVWVAEPLPSEVRKALERLRVAPDVARIAVMPDVHLAEHICVGTVVATRSRLLPDAVGGDIGCGMAALGFDAPAELLDDAPRAARLLRALARRVPALRHPTRNPPPLPDGLLQSPPSAPTLAKLLERDGRLEFATLGRGNHFLELQADEAGKLWLMVHSGSRAMGQRIRDHHLRLAKHDVGLAYLDASEPEGQAYLADVAWAVRYAELSRLAMVAAAAEVIEEELGAKPIPETRVWCQHNHVVAEVHAGERLWVHRKGAIPAEEGQPGIIPGSMGTASFHVTGRGNPDSLRSSSHGAGRRLSRTEARKAISARMLERMMEGIWFDPRFTERLREEAPGAYKDIRAVMAAQRELTRIVRRLHPRLSYKGA